LQDIEQHAKRRAAHEVFRDRIIAEGRKLEINYNTNIHTERTLDEAYYPLLSRKVLCGQNEHQVVSREFYEDEPNKRGTPILMVAQLWMWRFDKYIISAQALTDQPMCPVRIVNMVLQDEIMSGGRNLADKQIGLAAACCIDRFGKSQAHGKFPPPLQIFETGVAKISSDVLEYMGPSGTSKPEIEKEREFLSRISDIQGELVMIQDVLNQQRKVLDLILDDPPHDYVPPDKRELGMYNDWDYVIKARSKLERYLKWTEKINADAARIEKNIQDELNLKRAFATMDDARTSLWLGTAVIGFTVITVIFAPLAFVTALFALPVDRFERQKVKIASESSEGGKDAFTAGYISKWFSES
jgi:Mg2+ and Co2+ transporter CorA